MLDQFSVPYFSSRGEQFAYSPGRAYRHDLELDEVHPLQYPSLNEPIANCSVCKRIEGRIQDLTKAVGTSQAGSPSGYAAPVTPRFPSHARTVLPSDAFCERGHALVVDFLDRGFPYSRSRCQLELRFHRGLRI